MKSLQEEYAQNSICFGCGPANQKGLKIRSFAKGEIVECTWHAQEHHQAFPGMLNGGIIGALLDCHSNWAAAYFIMKRLGLTSPPCTVTAEFNVKLKRPTPHTAELKLTAKVIEISDDRAKIEADLTADNKICATCTGIFVAVKEGHPAYHRWG